MHTAFASNATTEMKLVWHYDAYESIFIYNVNVINISYEKKHWLLLFNLQLVTCIDADGLHNHTLVVNTDAEWCIALVIVELIMTGIGIVNKIEW